MIDRPDIVTDEHLTFLDNLRLYAKATLYSLTRDERWKGKRCFAIVEAPFDDPIYSSPIVIGARTLRKSDKNTKDDSDSGRTRTKRGSRVCWAREDDPIYKRGWTVSVGQSGGPSKETSILSSPAKDLPRPRQRKNR